MIPRTLFLLLFIFSSHVFSSVKIVHFVNDYSKKILADELFPSSKRGEIKLNETWEIYQSSEPQKKYEIKTPIIFNSKEELIFKNTFFVNDSILKGNSIILKCPGISYNSEILINEQSVLKHPNGYLPFSIEVPKEILSTESKNTITIRIKANLSNETFPPVQRFLFPNFTGGIFGKIKFALIPQKGIDNFATEYNIIQKKIKRKKISFAKIHFNVKEHSLNGTPHKYVVSVFNDSLKQILRAEPELNVNDNFTQFDIEIPNPKFWSPKQPSKYFVKLQVFSNQNLVDELTETLLLYKLEKTKKGLKLNDKPFSIKGVTYIPFSFESNPEFSYSQIEKDLNLAKKLGFNFIRFNNQIPDKKTLAIANSIGLLTSVDIPFNYLPEKFLTDDIFMKVLNGFTHEFVNTFGKNPYVQFLGAGSSFLPNSSEQIDFVNNFADVVKQTGKFSYASFLAYPKLSVNTDFIDVELYSKINSESLSGNSFENLFITGTYPAFEGNKSGSLEKNSFEAQGAFYKKLLKFSRKNKLPGIFINSLIDFSGDFNSLYSSYNDKNIYKIGIVGLDRKAKRIGYNVIKQYLTKGKNIPIPLGNVRNKIPILFIVIPLLLAVLIAFVINSRNKFREDTKRALLRSYNFFADIRDLRLLSGLHTYVLFIVNAATFALLIENVFYFYRSSISFDKIITSFGFPSFNNDIAYLSWHPLEAFFVLFFIFLSGMLITALIIKFFSYFKSSKIFFTNIFYTVVWALMPVTLLIPLELLFLKILFYGTFNFIIILALLIYLFWLLLRLFKGIYIVFDNRPGTVYAYGFGLIFLVLFLIILYAQTSTNAIDYFTNALAQIKYL